MTEKECFTNYSIAPCVARFGNRFERIFPQRGANTELPCFLGFVSCVFRQPVASPRYRSFFPVAETRNWHQDVVITRSVHFSVSPDRRVGPSTAVGRGPCVPQIKLSWKQTGTSQPRRTNWHPDGVHVLCADHGVLFPNSRMLIHFSLLVCWLQRLHATVFIWRSVKYHEAWLKGFFLSTRMRAE